MKQLGGLDNLMMEGELPNIPMHMSALMIYDTGGKRGATRMSRAYRENFETLASTHFPILFCKVDELVLDMDKAYWVTDPDFDLDNHLGRMPLPGRKDWPALYRAFSEFHARPLDHSRPQWETLLVEGLNHVEGVPSGASALFLKIHHAVMDGKSALRLISALHSRSADPDAPLIAASMPVAEKPESDFTAPTWFEKYSRAWWHSIERPAELALSLARLLPEKLLSVTAQEKSGNDKKPSPELPQLRFNHPLEADRVVGHVRLSMRTLRRLQKKHAVSINDIALCVVAGGLRYYLDELGELPENDAEAMMPIDIRRPGKDGSTGNHVAMAKVSLHTSIARAGDRLQAIHEAAQEKKKQTKSDKGKSHLGLEIIDEIHPALILWLGGWLVNSGKIDQLPTTVNTVVTNVPGISGHAWMAGAKLIDYLGFGPLGPNLGLFHTVSSAESHVNISFLSTPEFLGDGNDYRRALEKSWRQLRRL